METNLAKRYGFDSGNCQNNLPVIGMQEQPALNSKPTYVPEIDGLRAVAVISVLIYHMSAAFLPGGFVGVDIFFVISGYVVTQSLVQHSCASLPAFFGGFYGRRILRIIPALLLCLVTVCLLTTLFIPNAWLSQNIQSTGLYSFFGLGNLALVWFTDDYFSPRAEFNPFVHTWSLGVEEQFYLLFPLFIYFWLRTKERRDYLRGIGRWALVLSVLLSLAWSAHEVGQDPSRAFYLLPSRYWELAAGALLFQYGTELRMVLSHRLAAESALGVGTGLLALAVLFTQERTVPIPGSLPAVLGSMLIIGAVGIGAAKGPISRVLRHPAAVSIGKVSYSLYLWHWPVYVLMRWTTGLDRPLHYVIASVLTISLATASYHCWEKPIRQSSWIRLKPKGLVIMGGLILVSGAWLFSDRLFTYQHRLSLSVTRDDSIWESTLDPIRDLRLSPGCQTKVRRKDLGDSSHANIVERSNCDASVSDDPRRIFVVGDSHAAAYSRLARRLVDERGLDAWIYSKGRCSVVRLLEPDSPCADAFLADVSQNIRPGDIVFLASLRMPRLADQGSTFDVQGLLKAASSSEAARLRETALGDAKRTIESLMRRGAVVIISAPLPVWRASPFRCSDWFNRANPVCAPGLNLSRTLMEQLREPVMISLGALRREHSSLVVYDPFELLCPHSECVPFDNQLPLFFDTDHLSGYGNDFLYASFSGLLDELPRT